MALRRTVFMFAPFCWLSFLVTVSGVISKLVFVHFFDFVCSGSVHEEQNEFERIVKRRLTEWLGSFPDKPDEERAAQTRQSIVDSVCL